MSRSGAPAGPPALPTRRYRRLLALAGAALVWERAWPRLWPAACVVGVFLAVALFDLLPALPSALHAAVLGAFVLMLAAAIVHAWPAFRYPGHAAVRLRLEQDSRLAGRPLATLEDELAAGADDPDSQALWRHHQQRMQALLERLRVRLPRPDIARHEPWGIRAGVLLLLAVALVAGRDDAAPRLLRALDPGLRAGGAASVVELWITPPAYTAQRPIFLRADTGGSGGTQPISEAQQPQPLVVPRGSALLARVDGPRRAPELAVEGAGATAFSPLADAGEGRQAWRAETTLASGRHLTVRLGRRTLASWPVSVLDDAPPEVVFAEPPAPGGDGLLRIVFRAEDDYGVAGLDAVIEAAGAEAEAGAAAVEAARLRLPVAVPAAPVQEGSGLHDLAAHPLAGAAVRVQLEAIDGAGQRGRSAAVETVLPERAFDHPVARALIALRKRLFRAPREQRLPVAAELAAIAEHPERFRNDIVVSLALAVASSRLRVGWAEQEAVASVRELLWETALRIDQGDVPFAERQLERARQDLLQALQQGAPEAELEALMEALQQALDRYLSAVAAEAAQRGEQLRMPPQLGMLQAQDLHDLVQGARDMMRVGGREAAMQMLTQLQQVLDGLRAGLRSPPDARELAQANALMQRLQALADQQQALADDTFRQLQDPRGTAPRAAQPGGGRSQEMRPSQLRPEEKRPGDRPLDLRHPGAAAAPGVGNGARRPDAAATDQQALRDALGDLTREIEGFLGAVPETVGEADQEMRNAVDWLSRGRPRDALPAQTQAADALSRALEAAGQAMAEKLGGMISLPGGAGGPGGNDIFGRQPDGRRGFADGSVRIPDRAALQRAREIVEELRRRAAERSRPRPELEYIDRLLKTF